MINDITVQPNLDGQLVVDSRLISVRLGIQHKNLLETVKKYQTEIEREFGVVAFQTDKPLEGSQGGRPEIYALLTEDQATVLMTFSRNSPEVVACKVELVSAFSKAKKLLSQPPTQLRLKPVRDMVEYVDAATKLESLKVNPQLKRLLEDGLIDEMALMRTNSKAIASADKEYTIVKVRANELGYSHKQVESGSSLGRYVSKRLKHEFKKRIGDFEVMHYQITPELDEIINQYFASR
jgi:phage regulator Rha-like protein